MFSINLSVSGWNTVFVGTFLASAIYAYILQHKAHPDTRRIMTGFSLVLLGAAIRIGGWIPWRAMLEAKNSEWANWWRDLSPAWTAGGALVMIIGMTVLMWPALTRVWGHGALFVVLIGEVVLYFIGAHGTYLLSHYF